MSVRLGHYVGTYLPPGLARLVRGMGVYPRYWIQARGCRAGYERFGHLYPQNVLFIAGLPKSGTTWVKKMLASYPGFHELLIPEVTTYSLHRGQQFDYDLPPDMFQRFKNMLVVTRMHVGGSLHNIRLMHDAGVRYLVLFRDPRDVAVSAVFYVRRLRWHAKYRYFAGLPVDEGLKAFARQTLPAHVAWFRSWHDNRDPGMSLTLRYEDLLSDPFQAMTEVAKLFALDHSPDTVEQIVEAQSFQRLSQGRSVGQEDTNSHFRKGVAGDWKNHFTPELKVIYKEQIGDLLIELGYEQNDAW
jgi:hypothetical protein